MMQLEVITIGGEAGELPPAGFASRCRSADQMFKFTQFRVAVCARQRFRRGYKR